MLIKRLNLNPTIICIKMDSIIIQQFELKNTDSSYNSNHKCKEQLIPQHTLIEINSLSIFKHEKTIIQQRIVPSSQIAYKQEQLIYAQMLSLEVTLKNILKTKLHKLDIEQSIGRDKIKQQVYAYEQISQIFDIPSQEIINSADINMQESCIYSLSDQLKKYKKEVQRLQNIYEQLVNMLNIKYRYIIFMIFCILCLFCYQKQEMEPGQILPTCQQPKYSCWECYYFEIENNPFLQSQYEYRKQFNAPQVLQKMMFQSSKKKVTAYLEKGFKENKQSKQQQIEVSLQRKCLQKSQQINQIIMEAYMYGDYAHNYEKRDEQNRRALELMKGIIQECFQTMCSDIYFGRALYALANISLVDSLSNSTNFILDLQKIQLMIVRTPENLRNYTVYHRLLACVWKIDFLKESNNQIAKRAISTLEKYKIKQFQQQQISAKHLFQLKRLLEQSHIDYNTVRRILLSVKKDSQTYFLAIFYLRQKTQFLKEFQFFEKNFPHEQIWATQKYKYRVQKDNKQVETVYFCGITNAKGYCLQKYKILSNLMKSLNKSIDLFIQILEDTQFIDRSRQNIQ